MRNRDFRRLFLASVVSLAGDWFSFVAVASLVTELTGRPGAPAFVYAATVLPVFLASPIAGTIADRFDRKRILVIADLLRVPLALALCVAAWWRHDRARGRRGHRARGRRQLLGSDRVRRDAEPGRARGPGLGAVADGRGVGLDADGRRRDRRPRRRAARPPDRVRGRRGVVPGLRLAGRRDPPPDAAGEARAQRRLRCARRSSYVRTNPIVLRLVFAKVGPSTANGIVGLLPAFATRRFAGTSIATGLLFAARGLGAMTGPILARGAVGATPARRAVMIICAISTLTYCIVYAVFPLTHVFAVAMVLVILAHLGGGANWSLSTYGLQRETPDHVRGRVMSLDYGLATLSIGASAIAAGLFADAYGEATSTWILTIIGGTAGVAWLAWSRAAVRAP